MEKRQSIQSEKFCSVKEKCAGGKIRTYFAETELSRPFPSVRRGLEHNQVSTLHWMLTVVCTGTGQREIFFAGQLLFEGEML